MVPRLSITILSAALLFGAGEGVRADVPAVVVRAAGEGLDPSMRNEAERAVDLASAWLAACQSAEGFWGSETGRVERTAAALLALLPRRAEHSESCTRAAVWLDGHPPPAEAQSDAHAWRLIALLSVAPAASGRSNLVERLLRELPPDAPGRAAAPLSLLLRREALAAAGRAPEEAAPDPAAQRLLRAQAEAWPPEGRAPSELWPAAFLINRCGQGALLRDGQALDWRRDLAQRLINAQRRDAAGGYWEAPAGDARVRETAFGLLTLHAL